MMKATKQATAKAFEEVLTLNTLAATNAQYVAEQDEEILMRNIEFAERLFPESGLGLCPVSHVRRHFMSMSCEHIFGHPHSELTKMTTDEIFGLVHPDDLPLVQQCFGYIKSLVPFDPETYRFVMQYRVRNKANEYFVLRHENLALKVTDKTYLYFMRYNRDSESVKFHRVKLEVLKKKGRSFTKIGVYIPKQEDMDMTPRQSDIAKLITKGYSNQEIADQLGISLFTIKNHKKTLFKKVNVKNSLQLANYLNDSLQ